jgi:hypothetical protein
MQVVIIPPVLELFANARADADTIAVWIDGYVAFIEQRMKIAAEQQPILDIVLAPN